MNVLKKVLTKCERNLNKSWEDFFPLERLPTSRNSWTDVDKRLL